MLTINDRPISTGAIVHYKGKPAFIFSFNPVSGYINLILMDGAHQFKTVFPSDIGATWRQ